MNCDITYLIGRCTYAQFST